MHALPEIEMRDGVEGYPATSTPAWAEVTNAGNRLARAVLRRLGFRAGARAQLHIVRSLTRAISGANRHSLRPLSSRTSGSANPGANRDPPVPPRADHG